MIKRSSLIHSAVCRTLLIFVSLLVGGLTGTPGQAAVEANLPATDSSLMDEVGRLTEIHPILEQLRQAQRMAKSQAGSSNDQTRAIQRVVYLHTKVNTYLENAHLELYSVIIKLNSGLAELADRKATISEMRARALRRNSFINLISGGLTKIGGYSVALTPSSPIPTNVLEVFDGGVQTSLSALTLREQREEGRLSKERPPILSCFLRGDNLQTKQFPGTVWSFLNDKIPPDASVPAPVASTKTRRQTLIDHWIEIGSLSNGQRGRPKSRTSQLAPSLSEHFRLDEIDDIVAMTSDLKSVVSGMEKGLMKLSEMARESYKEDPEI